MKIRKQNDEWIIELTTEEKNKLYEDLENLNLRVSDWEENSTLDEFHNLIF